MKKLPKKIIQSLLLILLFPQLALAPNRKRQCANADDFAVKRARMFFVVPSRHTHCKWTFYINTLTYLKSVYRSKNSWSVEFSWYIFSRSIWFSRLKYFTVSRISRWKVFHGQCCFQGKNFSRSILFLLLKFFTVIRIFTVKSFSR